HGGSRPQRRKDQPNVSAAPFGRLRSGAHKLDSTPMNTFTPANSSTSQILTASLARLWASPARLSPPSQRIRHDNARTKPPVSNPIIQPPPLARPRIIGAANTGLKSQT